MLSPLAGHTRSYLVDEPVLKLARRFNRSAAYNQRIRIEGIYHFIKEKAEGVGLHAENFAAHLIARLGHASYSFGAIAEV